MKVISGSIKFLAILLMIIFVFSMPLMLLSRSLGRILNNPVGLMELVEENILDADTLANVAEETFQEVEGLGEGNEENPFADVLLIGIFNLSHEEWVKIINLIAPPEIISQALDQVLEGYFQWIDGRSSIPLIRVDLIPWKNNIVANAVPILEMMMREIPPCNPDEIEVYRQIRNSDGFGKFPQCRPPEPFYSWILDTGATEAPGFMAALPDQIDNSKKFLESGRDPDELKQSYLRMIDMMRLGWIIAIILFVIAIPMGVRSVSDFFKWIGWPLLLAGTWGLLIALSFLYFTDSLFAGIGRQIFVEVPNTVMAPVEVVVVVFVLYFARTLLIQSGVMIGLGGITLIGGNLIGRDRAGRIRSTSVYRSATQAPDAEKDDDTPSGMFG
jgi:hypothetical protein